MGQQLEAIQADVGLTIIFAICKSYETVPPLVRRHVV